MKTKLSKGMLMTALICGSIVPAMGGTTVFAEEVNTVDALSTFNLDPMVITAERYETNELKTPSAMEILDAKQLQATGATSLHEALKFSTGIIMHAQGPRNISQGTMTNKAVIRGVEKGTLVLVDGVPVNQGGRYNLEDIPVESIERVEIVRGGGAVLYGSEASGGVVNVITKRKQKNYIKAAAGNYGIQNYAAGFQAGPVGVTYSYDHTGKIDKISAPTFGTKITSKTTTPNDLYYNIVRGEHSNVNIKYDITKDLYISHTYGRNSDHYKYKYTGADNPANAGKSFKDVIHQTKENMTLLRYDNGNLKASIFYNVRDQLTRNDSAETSKGTPWNFNPNVRTYSTSGYKDKTFGANISNRWKFAKSTVLLGAEFSREKEDKLANSETTASYKRNVYSVFGQYAYDFSKVTRTNINLRETWTKNDEAGNNYSKFTPEIIFMHDLNKDSMLYAKAGRSFRLPTFSQLYGGGNIVGVPGLKPSTGNHYEIGYKRNIGENESIRFAVFNYKIKNDIDADTKDVDNITYENTDVKNTGVELEWKKNHNDNLSYHAGISYSHPQKKEPGDNFWHDYYGKVQLNGGVSWKSGKLLSTFEINYLGSRKRDNGPKYNYGSMKAQVFSDLNISYHPNERTRIFLNVDNIFNRHDIVSTSSSTFYNLGRNFMLGCEYRF